MLLQVGGGHRQIDQIPQLGIDRVAGSDIGIFACEGLGERFARPIRPIGAHPAAVGQHCLIGTDEFHAPAHQFDRQVVFTDPHALVIGHKIPALQGVSGHAAGAGQIDPAVHFHWRTLQPDADQLHPVVGLHHHLREMRGGMNTLHPHVLRAKRLPHAGHDLLGARLGIHPPQLPQVGLHGGQPLLLGID